MKALAGTPSTPSTSDYTGTQGTLNAGGDVPRSFGLGAHMTAGSLVYANYWGYVGSTPNAYFTQVIAVSDMPREQLVQVWVNGELVTPSCLAEADPTLEHPRRPISQSQAPWLSMTICIIKYYDGTQTWGGPIRS